MCGISAYLGKNKCFDSEENLEKYLAKPNVIDNIINGEGQNELLAFRAKALRKHYKDCTSVLQSAIKNILDKRNLNSIELNEYLNEAFKFCEIRKFNFDDMKDCEANFAFDFVKGDKNNFDVDPKEIQNKVNIKFYYVDEKDTFNKYLKFYGNSNLWWFVARVNSLKTMNIPAGTSLRIPTTLNNAKGF